MSTTARKYGRRNYPDEQRRRNHVRRIMQASATTHTHAGPWWVAHERIIVDLLHDYMHQAEATAPYNDTAPRVMALVGQTLERFYREQGKARLSHAMDHLHSHDPRDVDGYEAAKQHLLNKVLPFRPAAGDPDADDE